MIADLASVRGAMTFVRLFLRSANGSTAAEFGVIAGLLAASIAASLGLLASDFAAAFAQFFGTPS